jgi:hypothetical protein
VSLSISAGNIGWQIAAFRARREGGELSNQWRACDLQGRTVVNGRNDTIGRLLHPALGARYMSMLLATPNGAMGLKHLCLCMLCQCTMVDLYVCLHSCMLVCVYVCHNVSTCAAARACAVPV